MYCWSMTIRIIVIVVTLTITGAAVAEVAVEEVVVSFVVPDPSGLRDLHNLSTLKP